MHPQRRKDLIEAAKAETGWVYGRLPWFSPEEAREAERRRGDMLEKLSGALSFSFNGTKPHLGPLSPGCRLCGTPEAAFHFINRACTRTCFFCPEDRSGNPDLLPWTDGLWFEKDEDFIHFVKTFGIRGLGFTGGEPLLTPERLLSRMTAVRQSCGGDVHMRIYTNGDLADDDMLWRLRESGLNEIRFNIGARDYDLAPVRRVRDTIPVVTVEIPAIPEDLEKVKSAMLEMEAIGVDYLNLIQLEVSRDNFKALALDRYHVGHRPVLLPVFESEVCALELMLFRQERRLRLPVSYCGFPYRFEVTNAQRSKRYNRFGLKGWEEVTEAGFIRTLTVRGAGEVERALKRMGAGAGFSALWSCDDGKTELRFHPKLLADILPACSSVVIQYHERTLTACTTAGPEWTRGLLMEAGLNRAAVECWREIYLERRDAQEAFRDFVKGYPIGPGRPATEMAEETALLKRLGAWELLELTYPEPLFY